MRYKLFIIAKLVILFGIILPFGVFAETGNTKCSPFGYSILTINGIFTDEDEAKDNKDELKKRIPPSFNSEHLTVDFLHNPSHLAGLGDLVMSAYQKVFDNETVEDYDLVEMLQDASEKVKTQKLLLVAHSQGNFYANSFYDTVAEKKGGVPAESIGVYAVATPSGRVSDGGQWLTSDTDKIIADLVGSMPFKKIMPPNTSIILTESDDSKGHNFSSVYLKYRGSEIISAIQNSLIRLTENKVQNKESPCLAPPKLTLAHKATGVIFSAVDPAANTSKDAIVIVAAAGYQASRFLAKGVYSLTNMIAGAGASLLLEDEKPPVKTYSLWVDTEENITPISYSQPATLTANKFQLAEESLQEMQKQLLAWQNQPPSRQPLDGGASSESSSISSLPAIEANQPKFIASISPGFGGGGTGVAESSSSSSLPADEAGSSSSSSSASSANSSSSASESSSSSSSSSSDTAPPTISSLAISECQNSLSSDGCLVATTILSISWNSTSTDLAYFAYDQNGTYGTTTATSTSVVAPDNAVFSFAVSARDSAGNFSATSTQTAEVSARPVVINEAAWAGNSASYSADEWIELYNRTNLAVNLNQFIFYSKTDLGPYLNLSGTIAPRSYYLIERTDDNTVSDIAADLTASFGSGLSNGGENLALVYKPAGQATTTIDEIPYDYNWQAGSNFNYSTMERYDPNVAGTDSLNWGTNNSIIVNGHNAGGGNLNGTPKARNSYNYLINRGNSVSSNLTLYASSSPYLVDNATQIFNASSTLTIEPGVVIKFYNDAGFSFSGGAKILAQGTPSSPIVFTSFYDDAYGGDTNGNAMAVSPSAGNWFGLRIDSPGAESIISNAVFRYGGKYYSGGGWTDSRANLYIANSSTMISDSVFEYSKVNGAKLNSASGSFSGNTFRYNNNSAEGSSTGLYYENGGTLTLNSNTFSNNTRGLYVQNASSAKVNSNSFTANINEAIYSYGPLGSYANNSGSGNGVDAISLNGTITQSGATTTLAANPLPYLLSGTVTVAAGSALVVNSGLTLKGWSIGATSYLNVHGNLIVSGAIFSDIVFGSMFSSPAKSNWGGVRFYSGSYSTISGATFEYANTAIAYNDSPISLANVKFNENNLGVSADAASRNYPISASGVTFTNNTATTSPGLW